jgi:hypothetical protein
MLTRELCLTVRGNCLTDEKGSRHCDTPKTGTAGAGNDSGETDESCARSKNSFK